MFRSIIVGVLLAASLGISTSAFANDHVLQVYTCAEDIVLIRMQNSGWVFARTETVGVDQVNRIFNLALSMLDTGHATGYFNPAPVTSICGVAASEITVLEMTNQ